MEFLKIDQLVTNELNPNLMEDDKLEKLKKLIQSEGKYPAIQVNHRDGQYRIIDGHQRLRVLKDLGHKDISVEIWEVDEPTELMLLATMNKLRGKSLEIKKRELYKQLGKFMDIERLKELSPEKESFFEKLKEKKKSGITPSGPRHSNPPPLKMQMIQNLTREEFTTVNGYIESNYSQVDRGRAIYLMVKELNGNE